MYSFLKTMAASFAGKILSVIVIAVLATVGLGPETIAKFLVGNTPIFIFIVRIFCLVMLFLLSIAISYSFFLNGSEGATKKFTAKILMYLRKCFHFANAKQKFARKRVHLLWRLHGPFDYALRNESPTAIDENSYRLLSEPKIAFSHRFADAFPSTRDLAVFDDSKAIISRLSILLRWPLRAVIFDRSAGREMQAMPFYWLAHDGGNMHLSRFAYYKRDTVLLNDMEIKPTFLAAIGGNVYWKTFVYVECAAMIPCQIPGEENYAGQKSQEFAIYEGNIVNRREFDDGSYVRRGRHRRFRTSPDLRSRNLKPISLLIFANASPANSIRRESEITEKMKRVLKDRSNIELLKTYLLSLPKEDRI